MVTAVKKKKGECTTLEKIFHAESIAVAYYIVELDWLKKEEKNEIKMFFFFDQYRFVALEAWASLSRL